MSLRDAMTKGGQSYKIPKYEVEFLHQHIVSSFWDLKCGDIDYRIRHDDLRHVLLNRIERDIILNMDRAFLNAVAKERQSAEQARKT